VALDSEPSEVDTVDRLLGRLARPAEAEDVDIPPALDQRFGLAPDARIPLLVGVDDHRDRAASWAGGHVKSIDEPRPPCRSVRAPVLGYRP
jgi:hypothetical protein